VTPADQVPAPGQARPPGQAPTPGMPPAPEPLPGEALDAHCHLDLIEQPPGEVLAAARAAGITRVITVGVDLASSQWSAKCAADERGVYAAVAIHPNETAAAASSPAARDEVLTEIAALAALPQVRAVGETGLDYYRDYAAPEVQREWFRAHIEIAKQAGKALMIHDREAHEDILRILEQDGPPERVVFHCFSGDAAMARRCAEAGYLMSFAGNVTFTNAPGLREAAAAAPSGLLLAETDAPFLTPMPYRGRPNSPAMVAHTVRCLAGIKQTSVEEMCALLTATGERAFGPW
jgi:TatD DNase family protein